MLSARSKLRFKVQLATILIACGIATLAWGGSATSVKELDLSIPSSFTLHPSPSHWEDQIVYSIMVDRFDNGDSQNDCINFKDLVGVTEDYYHGCNPYSPLHFHGGDLRGTIRRLDYLHELGVTTLMLTPVQRTYGLYHGYGIWNFLAVEPAFGTMEDLKELIHEAHRRDMYVILDIVVNHTADVWEYAHEIPKEPPFSCRFGDESSRIPVKGWTGNLLIPTELQNFDLFNRCGKIAHWDNPYEAENGDFFRLKDLASWKPEVATILSQTYQWWIRETDIDGLRIDAIKHVDRRLLSRFNTAIRSYARALGKTNFLLVGEAVTTNHDLLKSYLGQQIPTDPDQSPEVSYGGMDGLYDTATYYEGIGSFKSHSWGQTSMVKVADLDRKALTSFGHHIFYNFRYIENLDTDRFLETSEDVAYLKPALVWLMTTVGIPMVTYGIEQNIFQIATSRDPHSQEIWESAKIGPGIGARADQFGDGLYVDSQHPQNRGFSKVSPSYEFLKFLTNLRRSHSALTRGTLIPLDMEEAADGIYGYLRQSQGEKILVILNTRTTSWSGRITDARMGGEPHLWVDGLSNNYQLLSSVINDRESWQISIPPLSARVMIIEPKQNN